MKWSRNRRNITMVEAANHLNQLGISRRIDKKHIEYWERLSTKKENRDKYNPRFPHPDETTALIEFYSVNGLWIHAAHREPNLSPDIPSENISAIYGRPTPRSDVELMANKKLRLLTEEELVAMMRIMRKLSE